MHLAQEKTNLKFSEYLAVYIDDVFIADESSSAINDIFKTKDQLKVKGDGKLSYHLSADYFEDSELSFIWGLTTLKTQMQPMLGN